MYYLIYIYLSKMNIISPKELTNNIITRLNGVMNTQETGQAVFWIIENIYGMRRSQILAQTPILQDNEKEKKLADIINRLTNNEPLQYVLGESYFYGRKFLVNPSVLIPRPETEELVHLVKKENTTENLNVLDIGTGSGCIAITLALEMKDPNIWALDIDNEALKTAGHNAEILATEINFLQKDLFTEFKLDQKFDIIISNPPYVLHAEKDEMGKNVLDHEPHLALFAPENDPLAFYRRIVKLAKVNLAEKGKLYFEINEKYGSEIKKLLEDNQFSDVVVIQDMQSTDRIVRGIYNS